MCGKFTAQASYREVYDFSQPLTVKSGDEVVYRPMAALPVIVFDREAGKRRIVPMRWGFPHKSNPNRPDPIHVRSETIDEKPTFKDAFLNGQRGIVVMDTFNEGLDLPNGKTEQWTIDPLPAKPRGFAYLWRRFEIEGVPTSLLACVMVTVPVSALILPVTDRMPAILEDGDWATWLGENDASPADAKAALKTVEDVRWKMEREKKARKAGKPPPPPPKQPDLF